MLHHGQRADGLEVAGDGQDRVVGRVVRGKEVAHVIQRGGREVRHGADGRVVIRVTGGVHGRLEALVPGYLSTIPSTVNDMPILYGLTKQSYTLEFSYVGPGMNHCSYTPGLDWKCYGFY